MKNLNGNDELNTMLNEIVPFKKLSDVSINEQPNAFVCKDDRGRIGIYLTDGGWIGSDAKNFDGDLAPFCD